MGLRKRSESARLKKIKVIVPGNNLAQTMSCDCVGNCSCASEWMNKDTYMNSQKWICEVV